MSNELISLSTLFQNRLFRIPDYQRGYAWKKEQLVDFWEDLLNLGLATLFWTKLLRTRNYFNYSSYPADFRVFNPLYSTGVR